MSKTSQTSSEAERTGKGLVAAELWLLVSSWEGSQGLALLLRTADMGSQGGRGCGED